MKSVAVSQNALSSLASKTLRQLRHVASELGVTLYSRKSKEELVEAISQRQQEEGLSLEAIEAQLATAPLPHRRARVVADAARSRHAPTRHTSRGAAPAVVGRAVSRRFSPRCATKWQLPDT